MKKNKKLSSLITDVLRSISDVFFNPNSSLNKEDWIVIQKSKKYLSDLEKIRKDFDIPKSLTIENDSVAYYIPVNDSEVLEAYSEWVSGLDKDKKDNFEKSIKRLLKKYKLRQNFYEYIQSQILYREKLKGMPLYDIEMILEIAENPKKALEYNLSTDEKNKIKEIFRLRRGIKTHNIPKEYRGEFKNLKKYLSQSKNTRRKPRTLDNVLNTLRIRSEKGKYLDAVAKTNIDDGEQEMISTEDDLKISARYRKQVSRFKMKIDKK